MRVFLDTNIILDFLDDKRISHEKAKDLLVYLSENSYEIAISQDMLTTIFYITKTKEQKLGVLNFFEYILKNWIVSPFCDEDILSAIGICKNDINLDFEDVLQSLLAKSLNCESIYTNDKNFYDC
ncbi:MAG: type II toxin-antitoxin system VapC family toxin [Campylobacteraceae bacterium]